MNYLLIDKNILIQSQKHMPCGIFKKSMDGNHSLFSNVPNDEKSLKSFFDKLEDRYLGNLYISESDRDIYTSYLKESVEYMVDSDLFTFDTKASVLQDHATEVMANVFDDPRSGDLKKTSGIVNGIVSLTMQDPYSTKLLMNLSSKDYYTFTHCINVAIFAVGLLKQYGCNDKNMLYNIGIGSLLHDIGKTKIPDEILNKPGKLTFEEFEIIKGHSLFGADIVKGEIPNDALDVVLHHHEKIGGTGYPHGLKDDEISLLSRIAAIADVYDALTTNRVYNNARKPMEALLLMKNEMLNHFSDKDFLNFIQMLGPGK